ncbi:DUF1552 domain-containing protein [Calycomorphotria hydatis]|uniref:DUF1552 domain-containing protein n=1 Tax=Calycomorphotria hydatis TaxID=2528027 RepID=A0A517T4F3_9PLAN|nr:DUF1552 domain-containing protein [Calycomorphotria hydatis]QDT63247.1 hypothetical protein V22_04660 [Calycomorphotria hydatis]
MITRRDMLHGIAAGAGGSLLPLLSAQKIAAAANNQAAPKRIIFFLQNQGFDPATCNPKGVKETTSLADLKLPEPISPLEPYKDKINIISGLHGTHTSPAHSAYFGALGGYRGGIGIAPAGPTIDHVLSGLLPETVLPHLRIGMESMDKMVTRPTLATLSATGPGKPLFMYSNPIDLYEMIFGCVSSGDVKRSYEARSELFRRVQELAQLGGNSLPAGDQGLYEQYLDGFRDINGLRDRLAGYSDHLRKFIPEMNDKYTMPEFETDWHDSLLDIGIAALKANLTNVLTIASGRGEIFGSWKGLGVVQAGHNLGHMDQPKNDIWIKIRQYNCRMLVKIMQSLEAMPEGNGTMMDNTLIVYGSNNADKQHTSGTRWPFILLGNCAGRIKTGQFTQLKGRRPINDLYTTLLHAVGAPRDRFNLDRNQADTLNSKVGPIEELMS